MRNTQRTHRRPAVHGWDPSEVDWLEPAKRPEPKQPKPARPSSFREVSIRHPRRAELEERRVDLEELA